MADNNSPVILTLETIDRNIQQKRGLFESYSSQSTEIIESYKHIGDFEEIENQLEKLIEIQLSLIQQLEERNKHRIPRPSIDQEEAVSFFTLISRIKLKNSKTFEISNPERYKELIALLIDHSRALEDDDISKAGTLARRINARFNQFA